MSQKRGGIDTSKADINVGVAQTSVKGPSAQLMSGEQKEVRATVLSALQTVTEKDKKIVEGPLLISPNRFEDSRGFFLEEWNEVEWIKLLEENKQKYHKFVQDNLSKSSKGVLRGLHFQIDPYPQSKLVRCISGEIFDVAVDLR